MIGKDNWQATPRLSFLGDDDNTGTKDRIARGKLWDRRLIGPLYLWGEWGEKEEDNNKENIVSPTVLV